MEVVAHRVLKLRNDNFALGMLEAPHAFNAACPSNLLLQLSPFPFIHLCIDDALVIFRFHSLPLGNGPPE